MLHMRLKVKPLQKTYKTVPGRMDYGFSSFIPSRVSLTM